MLRLFYTCFIISLLHLQAFGQHVFYGERNTTQDKIAVCIDQQGTVYPDFFIADSSLKNANGNLIEYYQSSPTNFALICKKYNVPETNEVFIRSAMLQDSVLSRLAQNINAGSKRSVTFMVHGYRKNFIESGNNVSSVKEFAFLEEGLYNAGLKNDLFVEVYWDATYDCCFSANRKTNQRLFELFYKAQQHAVNVGITLRELINKINIQKVNIIGHSLGTKVVASALFDLKECEIQTPQNPVINICLIAPAIGGLETFGNYYKRHPSGNITKDNYHLYILYNKKDFVLRKKDNKLGLFGPGALRYGNTTLGCDYRHEITKVEKLFREKYPASEIVFQDASLLGKKHSLGYYVAYGLLKEMTVFLNR